MRDVERQRLGIAPGYVMRTLRDVVAAEHADRRSIAPRIRRAPCLAVQEATDVRQERHEFAVVPLLELARGRS